MTKMTPRPKPKSNIHSALKQCDKPICHKLTLYIPESIFDDFKMAALKEKRTMSEIVSDLMVKYLNS